MKITIDREELLRGLSPVQAIVERRGTLPILSNVLIDARDDSLSLSATDLEVGIVSRHPAVVEREGTITLGARKLHEIVRELDENEIQIELDADARVRIESGPSRFSLLTISSEEYPTLPDGEGVSFVGLESSLLADMIDRTLYATSSDETRYNLNGVYMELTEAGNLCFVATDGHRMAKTEKPAPGAVSFLEKGIIVPRKGVSELRKLCDESEGTVELGLSDQYLLARRPGLQLSSRLIDGEYPNYRNVIPEGHAVRLVLDRERLLHAVRRVALVANERAGGFRFALSDGLLVTSASNPDLGEAREELQVDYQGKPYETAYSARYMLDALSAVASKEVVIELGEELAATKLRPADDADHVSVVMPMRL